MADAQLSRLWRLRHNTAIYCADARTKIIVIRSEYAAQIEARGSWERLDRKGWTRPIGRITIDTAARCGSTHVFLDGTVSFASGWGRTCSQQYCGSDDCEWWVRYGRQRSTRKTRTVEDRTRQGLT
jgi:hypothetical protein